MRLGRTGFEERSRDRHEPLKGGDQFAALERLRDGSVGGSEATLAPGASCCTVLVIDDDAIVRHSLEVLLETYGFQVALARNGAQGLAAFRRIAPDLVLTDIVMPVQDGIETILTMRRERHKRHSADYLIGIPTLGDFLENGLDMVDRSCEDFEIGRL